MSHHAADKPTVQTLSMDVNQRYNKLFQSSLTLLLGNYVSDKPYFYLLFGVIMTIWVDADACPNVIKEILFRAAIRVEIPLILVANHALRIAPSPWIKMIQVPAGFDVADNYIVQHVEVDDLVITSDIPLAAELIEEKAQVITSRGEIYTPQNIRERLNMRDFMETMRSSGEVTGGPATLGPRDKQEFANSLDRYLSQQRLSSKKEN